MRKSQLKLLGVVAALTLSAHANAAGLGGINVTSALGQPLSAEINLVATSKAEKTSLVARLASPDVYKGAGLEYPAGIKFKFQVETRADGVAYLKVSTAQPINDPFVSILVELTWSSGRLLREYTFLLDPPGYVPEQPKPADVQVVAPAVQSVQTVQPAPAVQSAPLEAAAKPVEQTSTVAAAPAEKRAAEKQAPVEKKPARVAPVSHAGAKPKAKNIKAATASVTVKRGDTLNSISARNKPKNVSLERMLVALYRANANQFGGNNMNRIKVGKVLHLPNRDDLAKVTQPEAVIEIRAQSDDWNAYRQKLASAVPAGSQPQPARQVVTGKVTTSVADKAPEAKESVKEVLKLSKGAAPGGNVGAGATGNAMTAQEMKNAAQEAAITKAKAAEEEKGRAALLEKNIKDAQRLAELKSAAEAQAKSSSNVVKTSAPVVATPQPSLVERIMGEPFYLVGIAAAMFGLGGLALLLKGGRQVPVNRQSVAAGAITEPSAAPGAPVLKAGSSAGAVASSAEVIGQLENPDPIGEADLLLNFGRDAQAEEVLKEALRDKPDNHQIHLKLLGIYASRKDLNAFSNIARQLRDSGDKEAWQQAAEMGRKLEPGNPLFGGAGTIENADSATVKMAALGAVAGAVADGKQKAPASATDFNIDLSALAAQPEPAHAKKDESIEFKLDLPPEKSAPVVQAAEEVLAGINLNLGDAVAPSGTKPENRDERWHEVATKLDLAKAYQEMGDDGGAREILNEVMREGDEGQRAAAQTLLDQLA